MFKAITFLLLSFNLLAANEVWKAVEMINTGNFSEIETPNEDIDPSVVEYTKKKCLIGIHLDVNRIENCNVDRDEYARLYERDDNFALEFDNTDNEVEFTCFDYEEGTREANNCAKITSMFEKIKKGIQTTPQENEFGAEKELLGLNLNDDYVTSQIIAQSDPHHELHLEAESTPNREYYEEESRQEQSPEYSVCMFEKFLNEDSTAIDLIHSQKEIVFSIFKSVESSNLRQQAACSLLDYVNKFPEDFETMNAIYLDESIDLNKCD